MKLAAILSTVIVVTFAFTACSSCPMKKKTSASCCSTSGSCAVR